MSPIKTLPALDWSEHSVEEIEKNPGLVQHSDVAWQVGDSIVVGAIWGVCTSAPWLWFALAKTVKFADLRQLKELIKLVPVGTITAVDAGFVEGFKFAEFCGFEATDLRASQGGRDYIIYRRV